MMNEKYDIEIRNLIESVLFGNGSPVKTTDFVKLFDNNQEDFQKFTKPYSIVKVIKLFFIYLSHKLKG